MNKFQRSLPMMLYRTLDSVMPAFRSIFSEFGITEQQWRVLRVLWEDDGSSLSALAAATLIPGPSLVGVVDRLTRDGLVIRRRSEIDRRVVHIFVTREGKALERAVKPRVEETYATLEASISPALWTSMFKAMDEISKVSNSTTTTDE
jgi:homoprotocatechuate degradation regulator HpaR